MSAIRDNLGARPRGYAVAEAVEQGLISGVQTLQDWSKDDPDTWSDDILRLAGGGLSNIASVAEAPGIKQALQVLGAGGHYGGKLGRRIANAVGVDERIGGAVFGLAGDALAGGLIAKGAKAAKLGKLAQKGTQGVLRRTAQPAFAKTDDTSDLAKYYRKGQDFMEKEFGAPAGTLRRELYTPDEIAYLDDKIVMSAEDTIKGVSRKPGSPLRARRATKTQGPKSIIQTVPNSILNDFPELADDAMEWTKGAYTHARTQYKVGNTAAPLKGYRRFVTPDGKIYKPKTSQRFPDGYQLKFVDTKLLEKYGAARRLKEAPWLKQNVLDELQQILTSKGHSDKIDDVINIMISDYDRALKALPKGATKGHFISLKQGGLDIAENFGAQPGRSSRKLVRKPGSKRATLEIQQGNYAEQAASSIRDGANVPRTWDEYINLKLPQLLNKGKKVKKSKPQWDGIAKIAMRQMKEGGLPEARWRNANTQFTWAPKDLGGKGRGYIDIIKDATADDDIFALKRQFFKQIDDLPSGTEWTLEADTAQKYRMYKRMFRDDPRIKPGGDKKLLEQRGIDHFVLKIP